MTKEERKIYMIEYRKTKKWKISKQKSDEKYYQNNKEHIQKLNTQWKKNNLEKFYLINKEWAKTNPDKIKLIQKKYRKNNPHYKIRNLFHNLKKNNYKDIIKPEYVQIKDHIESQFTFNMSWDNIEIDHKIPISWFSKNTPSELINDLRNLHPLLKEENRKKSNSYCHSVSYEYFIEIQPYIIEERIQQILNITNL